MQADIQMVAMKECDCVLYSPTLNHQAHMLWDLTVFITTRTLKPK